MVSEPILRRTALFDAHRALGAKIVPFGGFEMPVQYAGILAEQAGPESSLWSVPCSERGM